jgi:hypothetical protein
MMRLLWTGLLLVVTALASACDRQAAWGEANSIIFASSQELWTEVEDTVKSALEPRIRTVRDELMFQVTHQDPSGQFWRNLRRFKHVMVVGSPDEPWMAEAVEKLPEAPVVPSVQQVNDVWARDQLVTLLLIPTSGDAAAVESQLPQLRTLFDDQYRDWAISRMFLSGRDTAEAQRVLSEAGFTLVLPEVYDSRTVDSVYFFRNDNPDPSELIREIVVTWQTPIPAAVDTTALLAWRSALSAVHYSYPQNVNLTDAEAGPFEHRGQQGYQLQAIWENPPDASWPAAGPFILRAIPCPAQNRLYLLDAWLYAPGRQKYEYMIQLEAILDSFECRGG